VRVVEPLWPPALESSISKPWTATPLHIAAVGGEKRRFVPQTEALPGASIACAVWRMRTDQGMPAPSRPTPIASRTSSLTRSTTPAGISSYFRPAMNSATPLV
jgi:hypothetical protein